MIISLSRPVYLNNGGAYRIGLDLFTFNRYYLILNKIKNPVNQQIKGFLEESETQKVESGGLEPPSKQAIQ